MAKPSNLDSASSMADHQQNLAFLILLTDTLLTSSTPSSNFDFSPISHLSHLLRATARLLSATPTALYLRPLRPILASISSTLRLAQSFLRKCKHRSGLLRHLFAITTTADVRKISSRLDSSIADLKWLLSILTSDDSGTGGGATLSLPPIAANDPVLAWVWSNIAAVQHAARLTDRVDAANSLASLAGDNDRNKKMIVEEEGIPPLLKLLKDGASPESQIAAAAALYNLATDQEKVAVFIQSLAVPTIVHVLNDSPIRVRILVTNLVTRLVEMDPWVQEEFGKQNVIRRIVASLANDEVSDDLYTPHSTNPTSLHSLVQINKEISKNRGLNSSSSLHTNHVKDLDSLDDKIELQTTSARALCKLAKGSLLNSRKITETNALITLAKFIKNQTGELQMNCLLTVMELAAEAESNAELRRQAFKPNSAPARAVLDQLLAVTNQQTNPNLVGPAVKAIGSLARTFPAKETRIIGPLVAKIDGEDNGVAVEAVLALGKFVCPDNFNGVEHSRSILEFDGVRRLMGFLRRNENEGRVCGLKLLCYLALHVGNSKAMEEARALSVVEAGGRTVVTQSPELKELFAKAIHHLNLYQAHRQS